MEKPVEVEITTDEDRNESNAVNDIITENIDMGEDDNKQDNQSFLAAVREIGEISFLKYPAKTSNITDENASGMDTVKVINEWMLKYYKFEFTSLSTFVKSKRENVMSVKGYGNEAFNKNLTAIQASFQQTELPQTLANRLMNRR
jgi:hypothetical protein